MDVKPPPLYFDTAATTRVAPDVLAIMMEQLEDPWTFANPSSGNHVLGQTAAATVAAARAEVAAEFGCLPDEVLFTSGATEANNLALRGIALAHANQGRHLITSRIEHPSVLACCESLEREGFEITYLTPDYCGRIQPESVAATIRADTLLVSLMHTNNETGVLQPIEDVAALAAEQGVLLHVDAAQAAGKFRIRLDEVPIDLLALSAHKFHGPKGIGCLIVRDRRLLGLRPLMYGGGQEFGLRPGTLPTHQIVGLASALTLAARGRDRDLAHVAQLKGYLIESLSARWAIQVHGHPEHTSPYVLNLSLAGISSDALINQLAGQLAIANGSACSSGTLEPSHVLRAMGIEGDALYGAVRISFDRLHTLADLSSAVDHIVAAARRLQELSEF